MAGLLGKQTISGLLGGAGNWLTQTQTANPEFFQGLGAGLLSGNMAGGFAQGDQARAARIEMERAEALRREAMAQDASQFGQSFGLQQQEFGLRKEGLASEQQRQRLLGNSTASAIRAWGPEYEPYAAMAEGGMGAQALELADKARRAAMKGGGEFGLAPVPIQMPDGSYGIAQMGKDGTPNVVKFDDGVRPYNPAEVNQAKATGTAVGKGAGEAQVSIPGAIATAQKVSSEIAALKADKRLPGVIGGFDGRLPNALRGEDGRGVQSRIDQIKGETFMAARDMLKGGGQITDYEGRIASEAMARMDQAVSEEDFNQALDDFNNAVQSGLQKLQAQAGMGAQAPSLGRGGGVAPGSYRWNPATGKMEPM